MCPGEVARRLGVNLVVFPAQKIGQKMMAENVLTLNLWVKLKTVNQNLTLKNKAKTEVSPYVKSFCLERRLFFE